jgi:hypothetical protein
MISILVFVSRYTLSPGDEKCTAFVQFPHNTTAEPLYSVRYEKREKACLTPAAEVVKKVLVTTLV